MRALAIIALILGSSMGFGQATPALITNNGVANQSALYTNVNGFIPIVNGFPVIVGEVYNTGVTGSTFNQILYSSSANTHSIATYKIVCTLAASASSSGMLSMSISYTDAVSGHAMSFQLSQGLSPLSTTVPTLINAINITASNATSMTITTVLVSGSATYNYDCYAEAENHH